MKKQLFISITALFFCALSLPAQTRSRTTAAAANPTGDYAADVAIGIAPNGSWG
jgi:hypothetical protein